MDHRYLVFAGAAVLGALLGLVLRVPTIIIGVIVIFGLSVAGIAVGYRLGGESLAFYFGIASMVIPLYGGIMVAAAVAVRVLLKKRSSLAPDSGQSQSGRNAANEMHNSRAAQTPNKSLERTREG
jgi:hypothetical protein